MQPGCYLGVRFLQIIKILHDLVVVHTKVEVFQGRSFQGGHCLGELVVGHRGRRARWWGTGEVRGEHWVSDDCRALYLAGNNLPGLGVSGDTRAGFPEFDELLIVDSLRLLVFRARLDVVRVVLVMVVVMMFHVSVVAVVTAVLVFLWCFGKTSCHSGVPVRRNRRLVVLIVVRLVRCSNCSGRWRCHSVGR